MFGVATLVSRGQLLFRGALTPKHSWSGVREPLTNIQNIGFLKNGGLVLSSTPRAQTEGSEVEGQRTADVN
jgi:hypothetical protein